MRDLVICCIIKDENEYLDEWIRYHSFIGVQHFIICDNESKIPIKNTLGDRPNVTTVVCPGKYIQTRVYNSCLTQVKEQFKWAAFIDVDEFIVPKSTDNLVDFLKEFERERIAGIGINWLMFGSSGHEIKPAGPQIKNFTRCIPNSHIKSIIRPNFVTNANTPHRFNCVDNYRLVNENGSVISCSYGEYTSLNKIQINHYFNRSREEYKQKLIRGRADCNATRKMEGFDCLDKECNMEDKSIFRFANKIYA